MNQMNAPIRQTNNMILPCLDANRYNVEIRPIAANTWNALHFSVHYAIVTSEFHATRWNHRELRNKSKESEYISRDQIESGNSEGKSARNPKLIPSFGKAIFSC